MRHDDRLALKIRDLLASGVLPAEAASIKRPAPTSTPGNKPSRIVVGGPLHEPCTICGEPGPQVQYFFITGQVVRVGLPPMFAHGASRRILRPHAEQSITTS